MRAPFCPYFLRSCWRGSRVKNPSCFSLPRSSALNSQIARALLEFNAELRGKLKELGFLTRDAREHERKKYGQKGARKRFQFSKR